MSYTHNLRNPTFLNHLGNVMPNDNGWQDRHLKALKGPINFETAIVAMLEGWARYADVHASRYESPIGDDGVLGAHWQEIGNSIRALLNGECGRLDCGTIDGFIVETLRSEGFTV